MILWDLFYDPYGEDVFLFRTAGILADTDIATLTGADEEIVLAELELWPNLIRAAREHGARVAVVLAGGYARRLEDTVAIHRRTVEVAREVWR